MNIIETRILLLLSQGPRTLEQLYSHVPVSRASIRIGIDQLKAVDLVEKRLLPHSQEPGKMFSDIILSPKDLDERIEFSITEKGRDYFRRESPALFPGSGEEAADPGRDRCGAGSDQRPQKGQGPHQTNASAGVATLQSLRRKIEEMAITFRSNATQEERDQWFSKLRSMENEYSRVESETLKVDEDKT